MTDSNLGTPAGPLGRGPLGRVALGAVRAMDAVGVPAGRELMRRSLWGAVPLAPPAPPAGPPRLALSFDLDYQADTDALPGLVRLADRVGVPMTLFSIGALVDADPGPYREAAQAGHEIANHTHTHPNNPVLCPDHEFWDLSADDMADEIGRAQDALERHTGQRPTGFRTPHFKDAAPMWDALARFPEITYVSTVLASQTPHRTPYVPHTAAGGAGRASRFGHHRAASPAASPPGATLMIPLTPDPDHRWSPFCSYHAIRQPANPAMGAGMHTLDEFPVLWREMLRRARPLGFASVYFDPLDVMRDAETETVFETMLRDARSAGWEVVTLAETERVWREHLNLPLR